MPYRLTRTETVPEGLRRIAREEINSAASRLDIHSGIPDDESIHEARKSIKKLRAIARLLRPELGDTAAQDNVIFRDIGRSLSDFRDAAALIEAVDKLRQRPEDSAAREPLMAVRSALTAHSGKANPVHARKVLADAAIALRNMKQRVHAWRLSADDFAALEPGLRRSYRRGRRALAEAVADPAAETFHTLRKRVKDQWYQVRLLESAASKSVKDSGKALSDLQEILGDGNDLEVLTATLTSDARPVDDVQVTSSVGRLISQAKQELREQALTLAAAYYSRKPKEYVRELKRAWRQSFERPPLPRKQPAATAAKRRRSAA